MVDNISRLNQVNNLQNNTISTRLRQLSGTGSRFERVSRGTIDDITQSRGVTVRAEFGANRRSMINDSTSIRRYISSTGRDVNRGRLSSTNFFDTNKDGSVSDRESMNYLIKLRKNNSDRGLAKLMQFNQTTQRINENLNNIDVNRDGVISNQETMNTILGKRANQVASTDLDIVNMILENNSRTAELETLVARVDTEADGQISREEVLAVLTDIRNNNLAPALVDQLTEVLELNPDIDSIVEEFENSIGANYVASQHAEAQVLTVRRGQELQILGANHSDLMPSTQGFLEELAEIYGDQYLSDDENSPDFYRFGGLTGQIQDSLLANGRSIDDLINGTLSQDDMNLVMDTVTQYHPDQSDDIEASFAEQHQSVVNYIGQVQDDLADPRVEFGLSMSQLFDSIAESYGDLGFFEDGYSGFTGALQNALSDFGSLDATTMISGDFLQQISDMLLALPGVIQPEPPLSVEERLAQFADINGNGDIDMSDALRLASMIHDPWANAREAGPFDSGPGMVIETGERGYQTPAPGPEAANFNNGLYDFDGDGSTGPKDLRLLTKYIDGARGDDLYQETGETVQSYIENILSPDSPIGFNTGILTVGGNSYQGAFGAEITQEDIDYVTNIVQGNPEANYPDGSFPIHGDSRAIALGAGLLDVNNDGVTDMDDVAILQRYVDGARGEALLNENFSLRSADEMVDYLSNIYERNSNLFSLSQFNQLNDFNLRTDGQLLIQFLDGSRGHEFKATLIESGIGGLDTSFLESLMHKISRSGAFDIDGDGITSTRDAVISMQYYKQLAAGVSVEEILENGSLNIDTINSLMSEEEINFSSYTDDQYLNLAGSIPGLGEAYELGYRGDDLFGWQSVQTRLDDIIQEIEVYLETGEAPRVATGSAFNTFDGFNYWLHEPFRVRNLRRTSGHVQETFNSNYYQNFIENKSAIVTSLFNEVNFARYVDGVYVERIGTDGEFAEGTIARVLEQLRELQE